MNERPLRIAVTGASGLVGRRLCAWLASGGHRVQAMVRREPKAGSDEIAWNPALGRIDSAALEGVDAVVNLAGENVASGRWTAPRKDVIRRSRVDGTALLARTIASLSRPPRVLVSASAIGIYGDRAGEWLTEDSEGGRGFLADVCREWESATSPAAERGIRVVVLRIGMVLSAAGGALARMLGPFRMGMGGPVGGGRQYVSWIAMDDLLGIVLRAIEDDSLRGAVNAVAPNPVTNAEFVSILARLLHRPAVVPLPAVAVRLLFGEMGDALLLASARVRPARLEATGFAFRHPDLASALRHELGLSASGAGGAA